MKKIAFVFPGQGAQYVGMSKDLCEKFEVARQTFKDANNVLGFDLQKLCFEGNMEELTKTENTQPAILTASVAAFRAYMETSNIEPLYCAGHSLGEFSALTCSNAINFTDAVKMVNQRGKFMQEAVAVGVGAMSAVARIEKEKIEEVCRTVSNESQLVVVSNYNSPDQIVISGHQSAVLEAGAKLAELGARVVPLKVSAPFHSPLMRPAADRLAEELTKYQYNDLKWPVISNVTALPYEGKASIIKNLTTQIVEPVRWQASIEYLQRMGIEIALEIGPGAVLKNLMKKNAPGIKAYSSDKEEDVKAFQAEVLPLQQVPLQQVSSVEETPVKDNGFAHTVVTKCIAIAVCTKNRNWDNDEYQKGVVEPYRKIQKMQEELEGAGKKPTLEQMKEALEMLQTLFITKKVPAEEQIERFNQIFDETGTRQLFPDFKMPVA